MRYASYALLGMILTLLVGSVVSLLVFSYTQKWEMIFDEYLLKVVLFSIRQAFVASVYSLILGLILTRSYIHSSPSKLKKIVEHLLGLPFILPTIVTMQIVLHIFGHNGWIKLPFSMYSESGIILTHVILNVPFVIFLLRQVWQQIPSTHYKLAYHLELSSWQFWKFVEFPRIKNYLFHTFIPVFLLCFTSFTPVIILSSQPCDVTIEVAIYQSFMFELDFGNIMGLVLVQLLCGMLILAFLPDLLPFQHEKTTLHSGHFQVVSKFEQTVHNIIILCILLTLLTMGVSLAHTTSSAQMQGVYGSSLFWKCLVRSLCIALSAGFVSTVAALGLLKLPCMFKTQSYLAILPSVIPTVTLGAGLYIFIGRYLPNLSIVFVVILNAIIGMPFALRVLQSANHNIKERFQHLILETRLDQKQQWRLIERPLMFPAIRLSFALITAISFGDLGAIILFNSQSNPTLASLMYKYLESFDINSSSCVAFALLLCSSGLFCLIQNIGGNSAHH